MKLFGEEFGRKKAQQNLKDESDKTIKIMASNFKLLQPLDHELVASLYQVNNDHDLAVAMYQDSEGTKIPMDVRKTSVDKINAEVKDALNNFSTPILKNLQQAFGAFDTEHLATKIHPDHFNDAQATDIKALFQDDQGHVDIDELRSNLWDVNFKQVDYNKAHLGQAQAFDDAKKYVRSLDPTDVNQTYNNLIYTYSKVGYEFPESRPTIEDGKVVPDNAYLDDVVRVATALSQDPIVLAADKDKPNYIAGAVAAIIDAPDVDIPDLNMDDLNEDDLQQ